MDMKQDGVIVDCLPDSACCKADDAKRSPLELTECPLGYDVCCGHCEQYSEDPDDKLKNELVLDFGSGGRLTFRTNETSAESALYELQDLTPRINWCGMNLQSVDLQTNR